MIPAENHDSRSDRVTDSPWFWALVFSLMSLVALVAIAPKFDVRQRQVEGRFLGREQSARERERRTAGLEPVDLAEAARPPEEVARPRIVPLWTLATAAAAGTAVSGWLLYRERSRRLPERTDVVSR